MSSWTRFILTFCSIYILLLEFLSLQSVPTSFDICINLVYLDRQMPSVCLWNTHPIPHLCPQFVVISLSVCSFFSKSKLIFSTCHHLLPFLFLRFLATVFAVFMMKLNFVAFGFYLQKIILTLGHCPISCMLLTRPFTILRPLSPLRFVRYKDIYLLYLLRIHVRLLVFWSIRSIAQFYNIILPNIHYLFSCTILMSL